MNIRSKMIFGTGDYYERIVFSDGNNRWSSSRPFRLSFFFFVFFLFRFYFVDGVVTKLLVQYREPVSGRIYEDGLVELEIRRSRFLLRIIATLRWKNRLSGDISFRSPRFLFPVPILWNHCNYLFVRIIKWGTAEKKSKFSSVYNSN